MYYSAVLTLCGLGFWGTKYLSDEAMNDQNFPRSSIHTSVDERLAGVAFIQSTQAAKEEKVPNEIHTMGGRNWVVITTQWTPGH